MNWSRFFRSVGSVFLAIPDSYATILFSDSVLLGLMLLTITLLSPVVGLSGLFSLIVAILAARILGFEHWESSSGITAFNSLLAGMMVGYYYPMQIISSSTINYLCFLLLVSLFTLLLYLFSSYLFQQFFRLPSMSLSFSIVAILLWYYFARKGYLSNYPFDKILLFSPTLKLPEFWRLFFISLGSIFFTPEVSAGILVSIALLIITRIGFGLALLGWTLNYILMRLAGVQPGSGVFYSGFNAILIMYAVAGIYLLPGKSSILIGLIATGIGFLFTALFNVVYYYYNAFTGLYTPLAVPVFAFPFNIVVLLVIFSLRLRLKVDKPVMNDYGVFNPELALQTYQERYKRFSHLGIPQFAMPLNGLWTITQGNNGIYTHKLDWAYAWDFEMLNSEGRNYDKENNNLNDYFSFGKPVLASAAGCVVKICEGVADNPIGQVNTKENWGNYVCLSHSYGLYSFYAHLKQGSIRVKVGDYIQKGDCIAQLGNSGRSAVPHLHFQVQLGIEPGSPTRLSHLINYKLIKEDKTLEFIGSGIPKEKETLSALVAEPHLQSILALQQQNEQQLKVTRGKKQSTELWKVHLDLWGNFTIKSTKHTDLSFSVYDGIYNALSLKGNRKSALTAFALLISRLPYSEKQEIYLSDEPPLSVIISPALRHIVLLFSPLFPLFSACVHSKIKVNADFVEVESDITYRILGIPYRNRTGNVSIEKYKGLTALELKKGKKTLLKAETI